MNKEMSIGVGIGLLVCFFIVIGLASAEHAPFSECVVVQDVTDGGLNCTFSDGVRNLTEEVLVDGEICFGILANYSAGSYDYSLNCTDGLDSQYFSGYSFIVDEVYPSSTSADEGDLGDEDKSALRWVRTNPSIGFVVLVVIGGAGVLYEGKRRRRK